MKEVIAATRSSAKDHTMNEFLELSKRCETLTVRYDSDSGFVITGRTTSGWTFEVENADLAGAFREASEAIDACVAEE